MIAVLEDDPYRLTEVPRIGFRVADGVAMLLGIELDAPQRLRAGLLFALGEAAGNGNVFLPLPELWQAAARLLEVHDAEPLEAALVRLAREETRSCSSASAPTLPSRGRPRRASLLRSRSVRRRPTGGAVRPPGAARAD